MKKLWFSISFPIFEFLIKIIPSNPFPTYWLFSHLCFEFWRVEVFVMVFDYLLHNLTRISREFTLIEKYILAEQNIGYTSVQSLAHRMQGRKKNTCILWARDCIINLIIALTRMKNSLFQLEKFILVNCITSRGK